LADFCARHAALLSDTAMVRCLFRCASDRWMLAIELPVEVPGLHLLLNQTLRFLAVGTGDGRQRRILPSRLRE